MDFPSFAHNVYETPEYRAIFDEPRMAVTILNLCRESMQFARHLLEDEEPGTRLQQNLLHLDAALYHLRQALAGLPQMLPDADGG
jgi:hypothetical protein